jgi:hypothetical protein
MYFLLQGNEQGHIWTIFCSLPLPRPVSKPPYMQPRLGQNSALIVRKNSTDNANAGTSFAFNTQPNAAIACHLYNPYEIYS